MIREYIAQIGENKNPEDMQRLGDMLAEILYKMKDAHPDCFEKYKKELYIMAYGYTFTDEKAEKIVEEMTPYHMHWTKDQTTEVMRNAGLKLDENEFFVVMNMAYNDYYELFGEDAEQYVRYTNLFISDPDAKPHKVFKYFMD